MKARPFQYMRTSKQGPSSNHLLATTRVFIG